MADDDRKKGRGGAGRRDGGRREDRRGGGGGRGDDGRRPGGAGGRRGGGGGGGRPGRGGGGGWEERRGDRDRRDEGGDRSGGRGRPTRGGGDERREWDGGRNRGDRRARDARKERRDRDDRWDREDRGGREGRNRRGGKDWRRDRDESDDEGDGGGGRGRSDGKGRRGDRRGGPRPGGGERKRSRRQPLEAGPDAGRERPPRPDRPAGTPAGLRLAEVEEIEVEVEKLVAGGDGLARFEGIPLFVPRSAPGDRLRVQVTERRPDYGRAEIVEILRAGPGRREPPCPYFERCGGCDLQHLEDDLQTRLKVEAVVETLARLGNLTLDGPPEVRTAGHWGYRLRTQLHTGELEAGGAEEPPEGAADGGVPAPGPDGAAPGPVASDTGGGRPGRTGLAHSRGEPEGDGGPRLAVGYFQRGSRDLVPVGACPILVPELESLLPSLPGLLEAQERPPRRLDLAVGGRAGQGGERRDGTGVAATRASEPAPISAAPVVQGLPHGEITLEIPDLAGGNGTVGKGGAEPLLYAYDARCFFQTHRDLVPELVAEAVGGWEGEMAYDLYAGVGLFALPLARRYGEVVAVEGDGIAARYARRNARGNGLDNLEVEHQALETWIPRLPEGVDRVIVDPPRGGLPRRVRRELLDKRPARLTYVSCHAATLARDLRHLTAGYRLESVVLLDMFPQSGHMEAVAQLVLEEPGPEPTAGADG